MSFLKTRLAKTAILAKKVYPHRFTQRMLMIDTKLLSCTIMIIIMMMIIVITIRDAAEIIDHTLELYTNEY